jgi:hypothetical protein
VSVDTEIKGQPASVAAAAVWLKSQLATTLGKAADRLNDARREAESSWDSEAGEQFAASMSQGRDHVEDLEKAAKDLGERLDDFADKLRTCQQEMAAVRSTASGAGLAVSGFVISDPGPGPARPPDHFVGTEGEVAVHNQAVAAYNAHQELVIAYNRAASEAGRSTVSTPPRAASSRTSTRSASTRRGWSTSATCSARPPPAPSVPASA